MVTIKCVNPNCTAPNREFDWDETLEVEESGGIARPREPGAVRVVAVCPYCATENVVWVKGVQREDVVEEEEE